MQSSPLLVPSLAKACSRRRARKVKVGLSTFWTWRQRNASLAGVYLMGFYNVPWVFMLSLSSSNVAGATKKSFMSVSIAVIYGKSSIVRQVWSLGAVD